MQTIPYRAGVEMEGLDLEEERPEIKMGIFILPASLTGMVCRFPDNPAGVGG